MLVGSVANGLCSAGGFCAGSSIVVDHQVSMNHSTFISHSRYAEQRINGTAFVFSASMPALLATSGSEAITLLKNNPSVLLTLQDNIRAVRAVLEKTEGITLLGHRASPIVHFSLRTQQQSLSATAPTYDHEAEERILQDIVDDAMANGVLITRAKHLRGQEMIESRPTIRIAVTSALTKKEVEKAAGVVRSSVTRILSRRK